MKTHWSDTLIFITGVLRNKDIGYIVARSKILDPQESPQSNILVWNKDNWLEGGSIPWNCVAATVITDPLAQLLMVGPFGEVLVMGSGDVHKERIADGNYLPNPKAMIRSVRWIKNRAYVVGMNRQVFSRVGHDKWQWLGPSEKLQGGIVRGFESIDGFDAHNLYAVGWEGEIWHYDGQVWTQNDGPTNLVLNSVLCIEDGFVYACGQCGTLLHGQNGKWAVIEHDVTSLDFWDMAWFDGKLYISTMESLFWLNGQSLELVEFGSDRPSTCYHLSTAEDVLWSIGANDIMAFDGNIWRRID